MSRESLSVAPSASASAHFTPATPNYLTTSIHTVFDLKGPFSLP